MSVCPTVLVLRFYGCCHPCFVKTIGGRETDCKKNFPQSLKKNVSSFVGSTTYY